MARVQADWNQRLHDTSAKKSTAAIRLLDHLPSHPVLNAGKAAELLGASRRTGARSLTALEQAGVLVQPSAGKRNRVYEAEAITGAFAAAIQPSHVQFEHDGLSVGPDDRLPADISPNPIGISPQRACGKAVKSTGLPCRLSPQHKGHCRSKWRVYLPPRLRWHPHKHGPPKGSQRRGLRESRRPSACARMRRVSRHRLRLLPRVAGLADCFSIRGALWREDIVV